MHRVVREHVEILQEARDSLEVAIKRMSITLIGVVGMSNSSQATNCGSKSLPSCGSASQPRWCFAA